MCHNLDLIQDKNTNLYTSRFEFEKNYKGNEKFYILDNISYGAEQSIKNL